MYLASGSLSGIWLNTQQVRGLGLAWSCSGSTDGDDKDSSGGGDNEDSSGGGDDKDNSGDEEA